ncbi:hypothetical protein OH77DRAFT_1421356 [Trametes cingulata]|nr:hypothetical protein OH77DRAFT_1421356 [Trametes cingulata]
MAFILLRQPRLELRPSVRIRVMARRFDLYCVAVEGSGNLAGLRRHGRALMLPFRALPPGQCCRIGAQATLLFRDRTFVLSLWQTCAAVVMWPAYKRRSISRAAREYKAVPLSSRAALHFATARPHPSWFSFLSIYKLVCDDPTLPSPIALARVQLHRTTTPPFRGSLPTPHYLNKYTIEMASRVVAIGFAPREPTRMSCTKYLERRIVRAWKAISQRGRRSHRASILPEDFVMLTSRRRSVRFG